MQKYRSKNIIFDFKKKNFLKDFSINSLKTKDLTYSGSFSKILKYKNKYICIRDCYGSKKIFYGTNKKNNKILFSNNYIDLLKTCKKNSIFSVLKGSVTKLNKNGKILLKQKLDFEKIDFDKNFYPEIKKRIIAYLKQIKKIHGNKCYVCLSGGLDSTIIAYYAKKVFKNVNAITIGFFEEKNYLKKKNNIKKYPDLFYSRIISKYLKIKREEIILPMEYFFQHLEKIIYSCQDWRDFNVHSASLNFMIGRYLKFSNDYNFEPVLTGDMMNEIFADYTSEYIDGNEYYKQPKINKTYRQRFLINGLDSSDREVGVFNYFSIPLYQPYCSIADFYKYLPKSIFMKKNAKYLINSKLIPEKLFNLISKKKIRAQIGDSTGGILGYFVRKNIDDKKLSFFFRKSFGVSKIWQNRFINAGTYRSE